jgi:hypothetical protein
MSPHLTTGTPDITLMIATFRRPQGLLRAARSLFKQAGVDPSRLELVVVDNAPEAPAREATGTLAEEAPFPVRHVHEPRPGIANARNAGWLAARGELIASIDDDETADPQWLTRMLAAQAQFNATVVFGPVQAVLPVERHPHATYLQRFFSRLGPEETCTLDRFYGMGNSLLHRGRIGADAPFHTGANTIGGEDDFLFSRLLSAGEVMGWAHDAVVFELVPEARARLAYTLRRAFGYGQGPPTIAIKRSPPDVLGMLGWMGVGVAQTLAFAPVAAGLWLVGHPARAHWLDRTVQGVGKVLFFPPFGQSFYGVSASQATGGIEVGQVGHDGRRFTGGNSHASQSELGAEGGPRHRENVVL